MEVIKGHMANTAAVAKGEYYPQKGNIHLTDEEGRMMGEFLKKHGGDAEPTEEVNIILGFEPDDPNAKTDPGQWGLGRVIGRDGEFVYFEDENGKKTLVPLNFSTGEDRFSPLEQPALIEATLSADQFPKIDNDACRQLTPEEVLRVQRRTSAWWASERGQAYAARFVESMVNTRNFMEDGTEEPADKAVIGRHVGETMMREGDEIKDAPSYLVLQEMVELVQHASESMEKQALLRSDLPSPSGFAWLNRPFFIRVRADRTAIGYDIASVSAIHWRIEGALLWVTFYSDTQLMQIRDSDSEQEKEAQRQMKAIPLLLIKAFTMRLADLDVPDAIQQVDDQELHNESEAFMQAFWTLMQQRLTVADEIEPGNRAVKRRLEREGIEPKNIIVVTLRRHYERQKTTGEPLPTDYSHRWIVSGHWRNQWYPSIKEHRQKWIEPYEKGPEDKELVVKDKVFRWAR